MQDLIQHYVGDLHKLREGQERVFTCYYSLMNGSCTL